MVRQSKCVVDMVNCKLMVEFKGHWHKSEHIITLLLHHIQEDTPGRGHN